MKMIITIENNYLTMSKQSSRALMTADEREREIQYYFNTHSTTQLLKLGSHKHISDSSQHGLLLMIQHSKDCMPKRVKIEGVKWSGCLRSKMYWTNYTLCGKFTSDADVHTGITPPHYLQLDVPSFLSSQTFLMENPLPETTEDQFCRTIDNVNAILIFDP